MSDDDLRTYVKEGKTVQMTPMQWIEDWVPFEWRQAMCMCIHTDPDFDKTHLVRLCKKCGKPERWQLSKCCTVCKQTYFIRFRHHAVGASNPKNYSKCYTCLVNEFGEVEGDTPPTVEPRELRALEDILKDDIDFDLTFDF